MTTCTKHPGWIDGCIKSKLIQDQMKQERIRIYNSNPSVCSFCKLSLPYDKRHNKFCNSVCSGHVATKGQHHSQETKNKISENTASSVIFQTIMKSRIVVKVGICKVCKSEFEYRGDHKVLCYNPECFSKYISNVAKSNSCFHGNKNKHSRWYESSIAGRVFLESSWEILLATHMDENNIQWIKPINTFEWLDLNNKSHKYYPDFYIPNMDVYIEPKNPYLYKFDKYKIDYVMNKYSIKIIVITDKKLLTMDYINASVAEWPKAADL